MRLHRFSDGGVVMDRAGTHSIQAATPARPGHHGGTQRPVEWAETISRCNSHQGPEVNKRRVLRAMDRHLVKATTRSHEKLRSDDNRIERYPLTDDPAICTLYESLKSTDHRDDSLVAFMQAFLSCHDGDFYGPAAPQDAKENRMCLVYGVVQKDALNGFPVLTALLEKEKSINTGPHGNNDLNIKQLIYDMRPVQIAVPFRKYSGDLSSDKLSLIINFIEENKFINSDFLESIFTERVIQTINQDTHAQLAFDRLLYLLHQLNKLNPMDEKRNLINEIKFILDPNNKRDVIYKVPPLSRALNFWKVETGPLLDHFLKDTMGCLVYYMDGKQERDMDYRSYSATVSKFHAMTNTQDALDHYKLTQELFDRYKKDLDFVDKKNLQNVIRKRGVDQISGEKDLTRLYGNIDTANNNVLEAKEELDTALDRVERMKPTK